MGLWDGRWRTHPEDKLQSSSASAPALRKPLVRNVSQFGVTQISNWEQLQPTSTVRPFTDKG